MRTYSRLTWFLLTALLVLAVSAYQTVPAFADDGAPPPADTPAEVSPPAEDGAPVEPVNEAEAPPVVDEAPPADLADEAEAPPVPSGEASPAEPVSEPETLPELLEQLPEGTELVVTDETGEALPLVTEEAAQVIITGDPIWCPAGVAMPAAGVGGCSDPGPLNVNYDPAKLGSLLTYLSGLNGGTGPTGDGVIWIEKIFDSGTVEAGVNFSLNGAGLTNWANYKLTIKGGWNGLGTGTIDTSDPSELNGRLSITNWNADITISDVMITGTSGGNALYVNTSKNITLTNVQVDTNTGDGAYLDNDPGTGTGTGNVTITNSKFNNNSGGSGLQVETDGLITLSTVSANGNNTWGASLYNETSLAKNVTLTSGVFEFNNNGSSHGLQVNSMGAILLKDITATGNGGSGAYLDNAFANTAQNVTLTGVNVFSNNAIGGLYAYSDGAIAASNLIANSNATGWGADLGNTTAATALPVTLTGSSEFKFNAGGLRVYSNGAITLNNITATNNQSWDGAELRNSYSYGPREHYPQPA